MKINVSKSLQKNIKELNKEEDILIDRNQPWQDEDLLLSQEVDERL